MALSTATSNGKAERTNREGKTSGDAPAAPLVPFVRASRMRTELADDTTTPITSSQGHVGPIDIPAIGFLRHLVLQIEVTGGDSGEATVAAAQDAPFNLLSNIQLADVNGNPIYGPVNGFQAYLAEKYGAYSFLHDPRALPSFADVDVEGNFTFRLRIPVEISGRDGLGSLANMNASQTYKLSYDIAPDSAIYTTSPDTLPSVRVRASLEAWTQPRGQSPWGEVQETVPPAHGTTQYWSNATYVLSGGEQVVRLTRVGNLVRAFVMIVRDTDGVRSETIWPDPVRFEYDGSLVEQVSRSAFRDRMAERYGYTGDLDDVNGLDTGVYTYDFHSDLDGKPGFEVRNQYLRTTQATRLNIQGSFGASNNLMVLTNDIAVPAGSLVSAGPAGESE